MKSEITSEALLNRYEPLLLAAKRLGAALGTEAQLHIDEFLSDADAIKSHSELSPKVSELGKRIQNSDQKRVKLESQIKETSAKISEQKTTLAQKAFDSMICGELPSSDIFSERHSAEDKLKAARDELERHEETTGKSLWAKAKGLMQTVALRSKVTSLEKEALKVGERCVERAIGTNTLDDLACQSTQKALASLRKTLERANSQASQLQELQGEIKSDTQRLNSLLPNSRNQTAQHRVESFEKEMAKKIGRIREKAADAITSVILRLPALSSEQGFEELIGVLNDLVTDVARARSTTQPKIDSDLWRVAGYEEELGQVYLQQVRVLLEAKMLPRWALIRKKDNAKWSLAADQEQLAATLEHSASSTSIATALSPNPFPSGQTASVSLAIPAKTGDRGTASIECDGTELYKFAPRDGLPQLDIDVPTGSRVFVLRYRDPVPFSPEFHCSYTVHLPLSGHYKVEWQDWPSALEAGAKTMIGNRGALLPARCKVTFSLGSVKRLRASPIRRKQLEGLWERIGNRGNNILVTPDGWMVMSNGHTARFDWEDRDTIRFSDGGEDEGAVMKVAALSDAELKLLVDGRVLTFVRGQTLSEQEEARRTAEADERKAIARAKAAAAAAEVGKGVLKGAGYLALASLCVVAGVAAASTAGERSNEYDSDEGIGVGPQRSSTGGTPRTMTRPEPAEQPLGEPLPLTGCVRRRVNKTTVIFSFKCEYCGWVDGSTFSQSRVGITGQGKSRGGFVCGKCKKQQSYEIQR